MVEVRAHLLISGLVQGVFFRAEIRYQAQALGLAGWVRNCSGGKVEAVFEGEKSKIDQMITWCQRGPQGAMVKDVEVSWQDYRGEFGHFSIR